MTGPGDRQSSRGQEKSRRLADGCAARSQLGSRPASLPRSRMPRLAFEETAMTNTLTTPRRLSLAAAAFGLVSLMAGAASAQPAVEAGVQVKIENHRYDGHRDDGRFAPRDPHWRAMRLFDKNHNQLVDASEKKAYWTYLASSGVYGQ